MSATQFSHSGLTMTMGIASNAAAKIDNKNALYSMTIAASQ
jgi:hypothetical protein